MSDFEKNKIFAAILLAGITIWLSDFIAHKLVHPHELEKDAIAVEGGAVAASAGAAKSNFPEPVLHLIATADVAKGEKLSKACAACHSFEQGGPNKVGPNLWNVVNADKGAHDGFAYSDAMMTKEGNWNYASLNQFLWKPKAYISGTKMNYIGLKKPEDRAAMIAWLRTLAPSPAALPDDAAIQGELEIFGLADAGDAESDAMAAEEVEAVAATPPAEGEVEAVSENETEAEPAE